MKKLLFKIKIWYFWFGVFRQGPTSEEWSAELQKLIDSGCEFNIIDWCHADFGPHILWIANVPYASFGKTVKIRNSYFEFLPNKEVGYLLAKLLDEAKRKQLTEASKLPPVEWNCTG